MKVNNLLGPFHGPTESALRMGLKRVIVLNSHRFIGFDIWPKRGWWSYYPSVPKTTFEEMEVRVGLTLYFIFHALISSWICPFPEQDRIPQELIQHWQNAEKNAMQNGLTVESQSFFNGRPTQYSVSKCIAGNYLYRRGKDKDDVRTQDVYVWGKKETFQLGIQMLDGKEVFSVRRASIDGNNDSLPPDVFAFLDECRGYLFPGLLYGGFVEDRILIENSEKVRVTNDLSDKSLWVIEFSCGNARNSKLADKYQLSGSELLSYSGRLVYDSTKNWNVVSREIETSMKFQGNTTTRMEKSRFVYSDDRKSLTVTYELPESGELRHEHTYKSSDVSLNEFSIRHYLPIPESNQAFWRHGSFWLIVVGLILSGIGIRIYHRGRS